MSAYVGICRHTSAYVSIRQQTSANVGIRRHTSAYVGIRQHTSAYVSIRQHTSEYVSISTCDLSDEPLANANYVRIPLQHDSRDPPHLHSAQFHHRPHAPPTVLIPSAFAHRRHTSEPVRAVSVFLLLCERRAQLGFSGSKTSKLSHESTSTGGQAIALRATLP
jgi:hypothetical protein